MGRSPLKNNQPDAVLFSAAEYERLSRFIEHLEAWRNRRFGNFSIHCRSRGQEAILV
jgi:PHD/YefM family antitoxin component YafN of YafNO toxin-antitoxin module